MHYVLCCGNQRAGVLVADVLYMDKEGDEVVLSLSLSLTLSAVAGAFRRGAVFLRVLCRSFRRWLSVVGEKVLCRVVVAVVRRVVFGRSFCRWLSVYISSRIALWSISRAEGVAPQRPALCAGVGGGLVSNKTRTTSQKRTATRRHTTALHTGGGGDSDSNTHTQHARGRTRD